VPAIDWFPKGDRENRLFEVDTTRPDREMVSYEQWLAAGGTGAKWMTRSERGGHA
jgi:hypothetical protein